MVHYKHAIAKPGSRSSLREALLALATCDWDFCGENGDEYLWDGLKEDGYESNAEYAAEMVLDTNPINATHQILSDFINLWMKHDTYYRDYDYEVVYVGDMLLLLVVYETEG